MINDDDYLSESFQKSDGKENINANQNIQFHLSQKELTTTKRLLKESQAKLNFMNTENARLQNQNLIFEQSLKKSEQKFKEVIEKLSVEQIKTKELSYINKQLAVDVEQYSAQKGENIQRLQDNFNKLKNQFQDMQSLWDRQKQNIFDIIQHSLQILKQNNRNLFGNDSLNISSQTISEIVERTLEKAINVLDQNSLKFNINSEIQNNMISLKNQIIELELQNNLLKKQKNDLSDELNSANCQINQLLPKYREQIEKMNIQTKSQIQHSEYYQRQEENRVSKQHEVEKEQLLNRIKKIEQQNRETELEKSMIRKDKSGERIVQIQSEGKNRSEKKIKKQIKQLDDEIVQLQKSLEQEMGKIKKK